MSASYPGAVKTFATRSAGQTIASAHVNDLQDEVTAIEDGLLNGTAPLNSSATSVKSLNVTGGSTLADLTVSSRATLSSLVTLAGYNFTWPSTSPASSGMVLTVSAIPSTLGPSTAGGGTYNLEWRQSDLSQHGYYVFDRKTAVFQQIGSSEGTAYSLGVSSNFITSSGSFKITAYGNCVDFASNYIFRLKYGGLTAAAVSMNGGAGGGLTRGWMVQGIVSGRGSTVSTAAVHGVILTGMIGDNVGDGATASTASATYTSFHTGLPIDMTSTRSIVLTVQHGSASGSMISNVTNVILEVQP